MSRLLGLGFLFGAKDTGVNKLTDKVSSGFEQMSESIKSLGDRVSRSVGLNTLVEGFNFVQLDRIGDSIDSLQDRLMGKHASNALEQFGVQFNKTFKQATAGLGPYGKEVNKARAGISAMAYDLDVDAGEMVGAVAHLAQAGGGSLKTYGISVRALAGSIQAGILNGEQLSTVLTDLSRGYNLGDKGATALLDKLTALGTQFGVGADAARSLPDILKTIGPATALYGLKVEDVTESITRLAIATQKKVGGTFQSGIESALSVFGKLTETREQLGEMLTGLGSEFPDLATELGIASGDINESMQTILSDPLTFAKNAQKMLAALPKESMRFNRLNLVLSKLGPEFTQLVAGGEASAEMMKAASVQVTKYQGAFSTMAVKASGPARTFAENMDRLRTSFENTLNMMAGKDGQVLKNTAGIYKTVSHWIGEAAKRQDALGAATRIALDVRRYGFFQTVLLRFKNLFGKGETFTWGEAFKRAGAEVMKVLDTTWVEIKEWFTSIDWKALGQSLSSRADKLADAFAKWSDSVDWDGLGKKLGGYVVSFITGSVDVATGEAGSDSKIAAALGSAFRHIIHGAWEALGGVTSGLWDKLKEDLGTTKGAAAAYGLALATPLRGAVLWATKVAFKATTGIGGSVFGALASSLKKGSALRGLGTAFADGLKKAFGFLAKGATRKLGVMGVRAVLTKVPVVGAIIGAIFELPEAISSLVKGDISGGLAHLVYGVVDGILLGIPSLLSGIFDIDLVDRFKTSFEAIGDLGKVIWEKIKVSFSNIWDFAKKMFPGVAYLAYAIKPKFEKVVDFFGSGLKLIGMWIHEKLVVPFSDVGGAFKELFGNWSINMLYLKRLFLDVTTTIYGSMQNLASKFPAIASTIGFSPEEMGKKMASLGVDREALNREIQNAEEVKSMRHQGELEAEKRRKDQLKKAEDEVVRKKETQRMTNAARSDEVSLAATAEILRVNVVGFDNAALMQLAGVALKTRQSPPRNYPRPSLPGGVEMEP